MDAERAADAEYESERAADAWDAALAAARKAEGEK